MRTLRAFWTDHADAEATLRAWYMDARRSEWKTPQDIKVVYPNASVLPENRVVFNVRGNTYRLVVAVNYEFGAIYVRFVGTHAEYDKIDARTI